MATQNSDNNVLFGTTAAGNASTGFVGEFISSQITSGSAVSITTTTTPTNLTSISLTAGDWDVWGNIFFIPAGTTVATAYFVGINTTTATFPDFSLLTEMQKTFVAGTTQGFISPQQRIDTSSTTIAYIIGQANFTTSTMKMCGGIYARRRR